MTFNSSNEEYGHFDALDYRRSGYTIAIQWLTFLIAFVVVVSRRPDAVLNAQFFAEDGVAWFLDAYNLGIHSLLVPQASYLHTLTRLAALLSLLVPFSLAPLVMNLVAITVQILPVNFFLSSRFSQIPIPVRLLASFLYLALPNSFEIDANITTQQWHFVLLAFMVLVSKPSKAWGWRVFDGIVLVLFSLEGPTGLILLPMAAALWWNRRTTPARTNVALLVPGAVIQILTIFWTWHARQTAPIGATLVRLTSILGRQILLPSLLGLGTSYRFLGNGPLSIVEMIATLLGLILWSYALRYAPLELKLFILFGLAVFGLCLTRPLAGPMSRPQWAWLCVPGIGNRYYFLPMLGFLATLLWTALNSSHRKFRYLGVALLVFSPIGIYQDWRYPKFQNLNFKEYAVEFEHAPPGTKMTIPINPGWELNVTKH